MGMMRVNKELDEAIEQIQKQEAKKGIKITKKEASRIAGERLKQMMRTQKSSKKRNSIVEDMI